jgi:hypothetical protein
MRFTITVHVEIERESGKFAGREEMLDQIIDAIESANPDTLDGENEGVYNVVEWSPEEASK